MSIARRILEFPLTRLVLAVLLLAVLAGPPIVVLGAAKMLPAWTAELVLTVATLLALWIVVRFVERRPFSTTLFPPREAPRDLAVGFASGALLFSAVIGVLAALGFFSITGWGTTGAAALVAMLRALGYFLLVAVFEEALFRGIVFRLLEETFGTWAALVASAALFGLAHIAQPHASAVAALAIALEAGVLLGALYVERRTLWLPIGLHWAWDFCEGPVFGTSVSGNAFKQTLLTSQTTGPAIVTGGAFGPEAGVVAMVLCSVAGLVFVVRAVKRGRLMGPIWRRPRAAA